MDLRAEAQFISVFKSLRFGDGGPQLWGIGVETRAGVQYFQDASWIEGLHEAVTKSESNIESGREERENLSVDADGLLPALQADAGVPQMREQKAVVARGPVFEPHTTELIGAFRQIAGQVNKGEVGEGRNRRRYFDGM